MWILSNISNKYVTNHLLLHFWCFSQSKEELMKMYEDELDARRTEVHKNVAKVLTSYTGVWTDELIMSEIEWVPNCEYWMYLYASSYFVRLVIWRSLLNH